MEVIALQKFVKVSPKKMRLVADIARKMTPLSAIEKLPFVVRRGSEVLLKVVKSAMANARQKGASDENLIFKEIQIGEGPRLKRGRAASRGRWHPYKRRMSHVRVVLITKEIKKVKNEESGKVAEKSTDNEKDNNQKNIVAKGAQNKISGGNILNKVKKAVVRKRKVNSK